MGSIPAVPVARSVHGTLADRSEWGGGTQGASVFTQARGVQQDRRLCCLGVWGLEL